MYLDFLNLNSHRYTGCSGRWITVSAYLPCIYAYAMHSRRTARLVSRLYPCTVQLAVSQKRSIGALCNLINVLPSHLSRD